MSDPTDAALYHDAIVSAARAATGAGRLNHPTHTATVDNPLCGDRVSIDVEIALGQVRAVAHRVKGCMLCEAAAAVIGARAVGVPVEELHAIRANLDRLLVDGAAANGPWWPELDMFAPVRAYRSRHDCVRLPFEALSKSLAPESGETPRDR